MVREEEEGVRHPLFFLSKSAQFHEKKRVVIFASAKKSRRVRKNMKRKGIGDWESMIEYL